MIGVVNTKVVNVYVDPESDSVIIAHITAGNRVEIDLSQSVDKFYKIYTAMGLEGFCKKKYISTEG